jgi:hypothetical protein
VTSFILALITFLSLAKVVLHDLHQRKSALIGIIIFVSYDIINLFFNLFLKMSIQILNPKFCSC